MKVAKKLKKYFKKRAKIIRSILKKPKNATLTDIHKLRINSKKVRAIIMLLNFASKNFNKKNHLKPYKKILKQSGKLRDLQVEQEVLKKKEIEDQLGKYMRDIEKNLVDEKHKWIAHTTHKNRKLKKAQKSIVSYLKSIKRKDIKKFINDRIKYIKRYLKKGKDNYKHLHKFRKKLKIIENIIIVSHYKDKRLKNSIRAAEQSIGQWHDYVFMRKHFKKVMSFEELPSNEKSIIKSLNEEIALKQEEIIRRINEEMDVLWQVIHKKRCF